MSAGPGRRNVSIDFGSCLSREPPAFAVRAQAGFCSAPTGLRPKAQGCPESFGATLGDRSPNIPNRNAVAANSPVPLAYNAGHNAIGVVFISLRLPKVGAGAPNLGWKPQSLWDSSRPTHRANTSPCAF